MKKMMFTTIAMLSCFTGSFLHANDANPTGSAQVETLEPKKNSKFCQHNIQLQLSDSLGFPVPDTEFWVTVDVVKEGNLVTIQIPLINFEVGPSANDPNEDGITPQNQGGGYLYTASGFLPKNLRPNSLVPPSVLAASNNGLSPVFSFSQDPATLPVPVTGYIVQVTNAGAIVVQAVGQFGNIIPSLPLGAQVLMPCTISYIAEKPEVITENFVISTGASNITGFTDSHAISDGYRDSQVNDAFDGVFAWAWGDNSMEADKTNNVMNAMVAIGKKGKNGKLKLHKPVQLTNLAPPMTSPFDHAVAINRTNKKNIVVSYIITDATAVGGTSDYYRAVSFDGGKTFPFNGPLNLGIPYQKPGTRNIDDALGVFADKFGNIWYSASIRFDGSGIEPNPGNIINQPFFAVSTDGGITFEAVYTVPLPDPIAFPVGTYSYDYPQIAFGEDGFGQYGFFFTTTIIPDSGDSFPCAGFIPVTGLGTIGTVTFTQLQGFTNVMTDPSIGASEDGRLWMVGLTGSFGAFTYIAPQNLAFHSPGALDVNYAGPWNLIVNNDFADQYGVSQEISFPGRGYFTATPRAILYDNKRQALYGIVQAQQPDYSQNMNIYFTISRNNGMTWSKPAYIATSKFANRGYTSMALDPITNDLLLGWYDGRDDKTYQSVQYMGAILSSKKLDKLVNKIPLSDPLFTTPSIAAAP